MRFFVLFCFCFLNVSSLVVLGTQRPSVTVYYNILNWKITWDKTISFQYNITIHDMESLTLKSEI